MTAASETVLESEPARVYDIPIHHSYSGSSTRTSCKIDRDGNDFLYDGNIGSSTKLNRSNDSLNKSTRSTDSLLSGTTSQMASTVHTNLIRVHHNRDPLLFYTVVSVLGSGSMGSVAKVKKKDSAKGGSARPEFVTKTHFIGYRCCNEIFPPLIAMLQDLRKKDALEPLNNTFTNTRNSDNQTKNTQSQHHNILKDSQSTNGNFGVNKSHRKQVSIVDDNDSRKAMSKSHSGNLSFASGVFGNNPKKLFHSKSSLVSYGQTKDMYFALKSIHLERCSSKEFQEELRNEVEILKSLDHPNIVRALETYDYKGRLFLLLELCQGGDLYTRDPYSEKDAKKIVNCVLSAVTYLHSKGVVHRDLKFENICFADTSENSEVRIIDFGLSQKFASNEHLHDAVGTVYTMAPELLKGDYDAKVDLWSIGVITFSLLSSSLPFYGKDRLAVMRKIVKGKYRFSSKRWDEISDNAKDFVHKLLQQDPNLRPTGFEALDLPWLEGEYGIKIPFTAEELEQLDKVQMSIQAFAGYKVLKKLALMVIAYKSTSEQIGFVRKLFNRFDRIKDGEINFEEFKEALSDHYNYTDDEYLALFNGIDIDGQGKVHYIEFLAATIEAHGSIDEERIAEAFDRIDSDGSGYISIQDLKDLLGSDMSESYLERIINEADIGCDHRVSYDEFLSMWDEESEEILRLSSEDVRARRKIAQIIPSIRESFTQTLRSLSDISSLSSIWQDDNDHVDTHVERDVQPETFYFSQRKFQSMRKVQIDMKNIEF